MGHPLPTFAFLMHPIPAAPPVAPPPPPLPYRAHRVSGWMMGLGLLLGLCCVVSYHTCTTRLAIRVPVYHWALVVYDARLYILPYAITGIFLLAGGIACLIAEPPVVVSHLRSFFSEWWEMTGVAITAASTCLIASLSGMTYISLLIPLALWMPFASIVEFERYRESYRFIRLPISVLLQSIWMMHAMASIQLDYRNQRYSHGIDTACLFLLQLSSHLFSLFYSRRERDFYDVVDMIFKVTVACSVVLALRSPYGTAHGVIE